MALGLLFIFFLWAVLGFVCWTITMDLISGILLALAGYFVSIVVLLLYVGLKGGRRR